MTTKAKCPGLRLWGASLLLIALAFLAGRGFRGVEPRKPGTNGAASAGAGRGDRTKAMSTPVLVADSLGESVTRREVTYELRFGLVSTSNRRLVEELVVHVFPCAALGEDGASPAERVRTVNASGNCVVRVEPGAYFVRVESDGYVACSDNSKPPQVVAVDSASGAEPTMIRVAEVMAAGVAISGAQPADTRLRWDFSYREAPTKMDAWAVRRYRNLHRKSNVHLFFSDVDLVGRRGLVSLLYDDGLYEFPLTVMPLKSFSPLAMDSDALGGAVAEPGMVEVVVLDQAGLAASLGRLDMVRSGPIFGFRSVSIMANIGQRPVPSGRYRLQANGFYCPWLFGQLRASAAPMQIEVQPREKQTVILRLDHHMRRTVWSAEVGAEMVRFGAAIGDGEVVWGGFTELASEPIVVSLPLGVTKVELYRTGWVHPQSYDLMVEDGEANLQVVASMLAPAEEERGGK
ncbi:MAG: hypothetical protein RL398_1543 [Planctomycetota bacterium]